MTEQQRERRGRGAGSIEVLPGGGYRVVVVRVDPVTRQRVTTTRTFETKDEAVAFRNEAVKKRKQLFAGKRTLGEWLAEWLKMREGKIETGSWKWYEHKARVYIGPVLGAVPLAEVDSLLCERLLCELRGRGVSAYGQRAALTTLRVALADAVRHRLIANNPSAAVKKPKNAHREPHWWGADEARRFLAHPAVAGHRLSALFRLALDAGMRQGELFALRWGDVDWDGSAVAVRRVLEEVGGEFKVKETMTQKGNRKVAVAPDTLAALAAHRKAMRREGVDTTAAGTLFVNEAGKWLSKSDFYKLFKRLVKRAGVSSIRPYDLRHSCASMLLAAGASIRVIADRLGHEDLTVTLKHYAHCLPSDQEAIAGLTQTLLANSGWIPQHADAPADAAALGQTNDPA
jgi:integrase